MTVRYKMANDAKYLYLSEDYKKKMNIYPNAENIHFVDLLKPDEYSDDSKVCVSVRMFFPNGDIRTGWVQKDFIQLHNIESLFDGRFNSDK